MGDTSYWRLIWKTHVIIFNSTNNVLWVLAWPISDSIWPLKNKNYTNEKQILRCAKKNELKCPSVFGTNPLCKFQSESATKFSCIKEVASLSSDRID